MSTTILAVDLGKFNSVLCWYEPDTRSAQFRTAKTTPEDLRLELTQQPVALVVCEACSQAGWLHDLCEELGLEVLVANTAGAAWQWKNVKRRTDRDDALKLARLTAGDELDGIRVPSRTVRQWKSLIGLRERLVSERIRGQNRIRSLLVGQGWPEPRGGQSLDDFGNSPGSIGACTVSEAKRLGPTLAVW